MSGKRHRDFTVRGVTYADTAEAAAALGVTRGSVADAIRNGGLDTLGLGRGLMPMPVFVRGKHYASAKLAGEALGLTDAAIYRAIKDGRQDTVGLPQRYVGGRKVPLSLEPLSFPSIREAERQLGFKRGYIDLVIRRNSKRGWQRIMRAVWREYYVRLKRRGVGV